MAEEKCEKETQKDDTKEENLNGEVRSVRDSFSELCRIVNKPRPYRSSDFKKQHFIPDLVIALLMVANFAGAPTKINIAEPKAKQVASATHRQSQVKYVNYLTVLQKVRGC